MKWSFHFKFILLVLMVAGCTATTVEIPPLSIKQMIPENAASMSKEIRSKVAAEIDENLELTLWGVDSLVADPIAVDMDEQGRVYITRTNRQKNSEFDIRGHRDWEINSIRLQTPEERRAFLKLELSPDSSEVNDWFTDLNGDGSRDWKDLTVEKEQVFRIEDTDGDGIADRQQLVAEGFNDVINDCAGALEIFDGNIFLGVGPDMWRLIDEDNDGYAEKQQSISNGYNVHIGFGAHGMSGAEIGPDGRLYWGIGDVGFNGTGPDGKHWKYPNRGVIVRSELDGSNFEVFAMGLRNTHEFVFDKYANLISEDNDGDHPTESERLVYVVEGSDTGWRINWQFGKYNDPKNNKYKVWMDERLNVPRWEGQAAYITPCIRNYVNGPTGFLYNPGTALSPEWRDHFFVVEFIGSPANSGIHAFTLKPDGASFAFNDGRKIVGGVLPTGLDWGPDGAMYAGDWIEGWGTKDYGRIWKLDDPRGSDWAARKDAEKWIKKGLKDESGDQLFSLLAHEDMRVRQKAQFEAVKRGEAGYQLFIKAIRPDDAQLRRVHGIFGIAQMARTQKKEYASVLVDLLSDQDAEIRAQAAKWLGDVRYAAGPELTTLLKDTVMRVRFFAAEALGRIAYAPAQEELIQLLIDNDDKDAYIRHAGSLALARIGDAERLGQLADHPSRALRIAAVVALRRMQNKAIVHFIDDEEVLVVRDVARAINDDWSIEEALDDLGAILNNTFEDEVIIRRAINANLRVGTDQSLQRVLDYAMTETHPTELRSEALATIRHWQSPSVLDRVTGRYRGKITRDVKTIRPIIEKGITQLLADDKSTIIKEAAYVAGQNKLVSAASKLRKMLSEAEYASVRSAALESLVLMEVEDLPAILATALKDKDLVVRVAALDASRKVGLPPEDELSLYRSVVFDKTISERQSAIAAMSNLPAEVVTPTFNELLAQWSKQELDTKVRLDVAEAITAINDPELTRKLSEVQGMDDQSDVMAAYIDCLSGGDPGRGGRIIWNHTGAQCIRCHQMHDYGGIAGPPLTHIGDQLTPKELLESLVMPNARIAPGYGMVSLILKDGTEIDGMLIKEEGDQLTIRDAENNTIEVDQEQVDERIDALSGMTDMKKILTKREIRDVVAYLTTLKKSPGPSD